MNPGFTPRELSEGLKRLWIYSAVTAIALSLLAVAIVIGNIVAGTTPGPDENAWAHLFQLAMAAQVPLLLLFLLLADWRQCRRAMVLLGGQIIAAATALGVLACSGY